MSECIAVFGATSAIAQATMSYYAKENARFILIARQKDRLEILRKNLLAQGAQQVHYLTCDFAQPNEVMGIWQRCLSITHDIDSVLVAYGVLSDQVECEKNQTAAQANYFINLTSPVMLLETIADTFARLEKGQITVISSVAGDRGRRTNYHYGAAKAGLNAFCSGLRSRLSPKNVAVLTVKPGFVDTPMTANIKKNLLFSPPAKVGKDIYKAMKKGREVIYTPSYWRFILGIIRLIPEFLFKKLPI